MKKILFSAGMIILVAAVSYGASGAFFSDSETSTGNTFTAGSIDLQVDSQAHYAGLICTGGVWVDDNPTSTTRPDLVGDPCSGTWELTDLGPTNTFFNLSDLKPGDSGENTISLHVNNNDAYVCAVVDNLHDNDNGLTEPEEDAGDTTGGADQGDLAPELNFFAWGETDGDNVWESGELPLFTNQQGPASDVLDGVSYPLFTPATTAMAGGSTQYVGLYWCYGDITVGANTLSCDGESVTNMSQTDGITADISFYVEQARNNSNFTCPNPGPTQPQTFVGATLGAYVAPACSATVAGASSIQTAIDAATAGQTVCVDPTYTGAGDNVAIQVNKDITLAATTQGVNLDVPVVLASDGVTVTGFDGVIGQAASPSEQAAFYVLGTTDNFEISFNTVTGGSGAGVLTETGGTNNNGLIANNVLSGATQGIYTNPHTGTIVIEKNDINNNVAGIGGLMGATVRYNQFNHTVAASEAIGVDSLSDSNPATVNFNNFLNGIKLNDYGATAIVNAENNFWNLGGVNQTTASQVDFTPEAGAAYAHN